MTVRKKLIAGNWKMNGALEQNASLLNELKSGLSEGVDGAIFAPYPYLAQLQATLQGTAWMWGAQDVSVHASGAYTGEVSVSMLQNFGVQAAIVGHSERRAYHHESSQLVADKASACIAKGVLPVVCIGETLDDREQGKTFDVIAGQLDPVIEKLAQSVKDGVWPLVLAYEPVWAIGTGKTASPEQAQEVHAFIRERLNTLLGAQVSQSTRILYGGSVKASNAKELFSQSDIDGALVGGASLIASDFLGIISAANELK